MHQLERVNHVNCEHHMYHEDSVIAVMRAEIMCYEINFMQTETETDAHVCPFVMTLSVSVTSLANTDLITLI